MTTAPAQAAAAALQAHRIRPLETMEELRACVALQREVWGAAFAECVPVSILKVSQRLGGLAAGAWDEQGRLSGFVFGLTGVVEGRPVHWSDMLAVRRDRRGSGLGLALKLYQREELLGRGVAVCQWTFDPLESRDAHLNLGRLGELVREYRVDMYGESDSPLHRGMATDRFVALWLLDSVRVTARVGRGEGPPALAERAHLPRAFEVREREGLAVPGDSRRGERDVEAFLVPVPSDIQEVKARDPALALAWREATREVFVGALTRGMQVTELLRGAGPVAHYLVERRNGPAGEGEG